MEKSCVEVIGDFLNSERSQGKSDLTIKTYGHALEKFAGWLTDNNGDIQNLTRYDVQSYIKYLEASGKSASTINKIFAAMSVYLKFVGMSAIGNSIRLPEARKTRNIAPKSLERNERNKLLRDVERDGNMRNIAITYTLLLTGLRVSELAALNVADVTLSERSGSLTVRNGKGNVTRTVPLPSETRYHLKRYLKTRDDDSEPLFLSNYRKRISVRTVQHMLASYGVHPHELRHSYCRELVSKGIDIATVAELAGHTDINVTRRYSKPTMRDLQEAIDRAFN